ncbi:hypothetical protein, partial [Burkholderia pseudomallei]|uniref:hypothetical protein n=1 Tax=Burkholderia pseudomallei TaxID=28450 RepID=UPI001F266695
GYKQSGNERHLNAGLSRSSICLSGIDNQENCNATVDPRGGMLRPRLVARGMCGHAAASGARARAAPQSAGGRL